MKIPKHDLRYAATPLQVVMCSRKLGCSCEIQFGKMCDVCACGAILDVQSTITFCNFHICQFSHLSLNKIGPDSLIFFNGLFSEL